MVSVGDLKDGDIVMIRHLVINGKGRVDPETGEWGYPKVLHNEPAKYRACGHVTFPDLYEDLPCEARGGHDDEFFLFGSEVGVPAQNAEVLFIAQIVSIEVQW